MILCVKTKYNGCTDSSQKSMMLLDWYLGGIGKKEGIFLHTSKGSLYDMMSIFFNDVYVVPRKGSGSADCVQRDRYIVYVV